MTWTESHSVSQSPEHLRLSLQPLTWIFSPLKDFIMIGTRWEERETSGNICDQTQRMVKMGLCNTVNLCSHTFRHFSLQAKHSGSAAQRFSSDVQTHSSHKHSLFLSADAGTAETLLWRQPKRKQIFFDLMIMAPGHGSRYKRCVGVNQSERVRSSPPPRLATLWIH